MKYLSLLSLTLLLSVFSCQGQNNTKKIITQDTISKIEVIDFYSTHRCVTCEAIEANTKYTIETYFKDAVKAGFLEFKAINVDLKEHYDIAEKFEASGTALFINVIKKGQEKHIDLTNFAFAKGRDKESFSSELKLKIEEQIKLL